MKIVLANMSKYSQVILFFRKQEITLTTKIVSLNPGHCATKYYCWFHFYSMQYVSIKKLKVHSRDGGRSKNGRGGSNRWSRDFICKPHYKNSKMEYIQSWTLSVFIPRHFEQNTLMPCPCSVFQSVNRFKPLHGLKL